MSRSTIFIFGTHSGGYVDSSIETFPEPFFVWVLTNDIIHKPLLNSLQNLMYECKILLFLLQGACTQIGVKIPFLVRLTPLSPKNKKLNSLIFSIFSHIWQHQFYFFFFINKFIKTFNYILIIIIFILY